MKISQTTFLILYLLPNDDEQRQTHLSNSGVFNEHFHFLVNVLFLTKKQRVLFVFQIKPNELPGRTLRLTAYTVDSSTRIRQALGHVYVKLDQFFNGNQLDKTFTTKTLCESLIQDPQIRSDYLGELILTNTYFKDRNLLQIRIQQINHLHLSSTKTSLEGTSPGFYSPNSLFLCFQLTSVVKHRMSVRIILGLKHLHFLFYPRHLFVLIKN